MMHKAFNNCLSELLEKSKEEELKNWDTIMSFVGQAACKINPRKSSNKHGSITMLTPSPDSSMLEMLLNTLYNKREKLEQTLQKILNVIGKHAIKPGKLLTKPRNNG